MPSPRARLGTPFTKRADNTTQPVPPQANNGNGASLDIASLQREVSSIRLQLMQLDTDKEQLALPSLQGNAEAVHKMAEIEAQHATLTQRKKTLEAAIRELKARENTQRWRRRIPQLIQVVHYSLHTTWLTYAPRVTGNHVGRGSRSSILERLLAERGPDGTRALKAELNHFDSLPRIFAREAAECAIPEVRTEGYRIGDNEDHAHYQRQKAKLEEQRAAQVNELVEVILAGLPEMKRPKGLDELLAKCRDTVIRDTERHKRNSQSKAVQ